MDCSDDSYDSDFAPVIEDLLEVRKKSNPFNVAQTAHLNTLFKAGMTSASAKHRSVLQRAADDTGLTVQQVVVSYEDGA